MSSAENLRRCTLSAKTYLKLFLLNKFKFLLSHGSLHNFVSRGKVCVGVRLGKEVKSVLQKRIFTIYLFIF